MAASSCLGVQAVVTFDIGLGLKAQDQELGCLEVRTASSFAVHQAVKQVQCTGFGCNALNQSHLGSWQNSCSSLCKTKAKTSTISLSPPCLPSKLLYPFYGLQTRQLERALTGKGGAWLKAFRLNARGPSCLRALACVTLGSLPGRHFSYDFRLACLEGSSC